MIGFLLYNFVVGLSWFVSVCFDEQGHEQTWNMQQSNEFASVQAFLNNNPDIQNSNTLDLHGLQVREALNVLKQVIAEKRSGNLNKLSLVWVCFVLY